MLERIEKLEQVLRKELDDAIKNKDFDSARQIDFAIQGLLADTSKREFEDKYDKMKEFEILDAFDFWQEVI